MKMNIDKVVCFEMAVSRSGLRLQLNFSWFQVVAGPRIPRFAGGLPASYHAD